MGSGGERRGLTLPAPAGPMTSTPNLDIVKFLCVGGRMLKSAHTLEGMGIGEAEEEGLFCYAIIEICSAACSASPERLTNEKAALVTSGYMGLGGLVVETRRENKQIRSTPQYNFVVSRGCSTSQYPPDVFSFKKVQGLGFSHAARVLL